MKRIILIVFLIFITKVNSQDLKWYNNVNEVVKLATTKNRPVLMFFTGSDWCGWCTRMQDHVFKTKMFKNWVKTNKVILYELDFPRTKTLPKEISGANNYFNQKFKVTGFPTVFFVKFVKSTTSKTTNIVTLSRTGYPGQGLANWMKEADEAIHKKINTKTK